MEIFCFLIAAEELEFGADWVSFDAPATANSKHERPARVPEETMNRNRKLLRGTNTSSVDSRISYGFIAQANQFPFVVALARIAPPNYYHAFCTGSIIHPRFILTAGK